VTLTRIRAFARIPVNIHRNTLAIFRFGRRPVEKRPGVSSVSEPVKKGPAPDRGGNSSAREGCGQHGLWRHRGRELELEPGLRQAAGLAITRSNALQNRK
jgi:hypothetical protein